MASTYHAEYLSQKVAYDLRLAFFQQLQRLSFGFHDKIHSGDLITRGMLDLEGSRAFIQGAMQPFLGLSLLLAFAAYMMIATDPVMALIGLAFVPVAGVALGRMGFLLRVTWLRVQEMMSGLTLTMEENLQGIRVVRAFAGRRFELGKFDAASNEVLAFQYKRITLRFRGVAWMMISFNASLGLLLWYGGAQGAGGRDDGGRLTEFLTYMTLLQAPIRQIAMIFNSMARATSSGARLFEILDLEPTIADAPGAKPLEAPKGVLRFEHVDFQYDPGKPVLSDISFEVRPGRTLGIVGASGQRQVDDRQPDSALLRRHRRADHHRWPGHPRGDAGVPARIRRPGAAGGVPVRRLGRPQTSPMPIPGRRTSGSRARPGPPRSTSTSPACRKPTRPASASAASRSRAASASG